MLITAQEIVKIRKESGLDLAEFGALFLVSASTVKYWEKGTRNLQPIMVVILEAVRDKINIYANSEYFRNELERKIALEGTHSILKWLYTNEHIQEFTPNHTCTCNGILPV